MSALLGKELRGLRRVRTYILAGVVTLLPIVATWFALRWLFQLMDQLIRNLLPVAVRASLPPGVGIIAGLLVLLLTGFVVTHAGGRRVLNWAEGLLHRMPVVKSFYGLARSLTDALFSNTRQAFKQAALIEYPTEDTYTLAFVTGRVGFAYSLFVPTTPNPTSGWYLVVPAERVVTLKSVPIEAAMKVIISGGVFGVDADAQSEIQAAIRILRERR